jgi:hypothetical protein
MCVQPSASTTDSAAFSVVENIEPPKFPDKFSWSSARNNNAEKYDLMKNYMEEKYKDAEDWESPYLILPNICFTQMHSERFKPFMNNISIFS